MLVEMLIEIHVQDSDAAAVSTRTISGAGGGGQYYMDNTGQFYTQNYERVTSHLSPELSLVPLKYPTKTPFTSVNNRFLC